jgi:hypothetical protein
VSDTGVNFTERAAGAFARAASTYGYEVYLPVCIDSRRSRLLWGSGNTRQNRINPARKAYAGFPNPLTLHVTSLEKWWIAPKPHPDLQSHPQAKPCNAQSCVGGCVEIQVPHVFHAPMLQSEFPPQRNSDRAFQYIHRKLYPVKKHA